VQTGWKASRHGWTGLELDGGWKGRGKEEEGKRKGRGKRGGHTMTSPPSYAAMSQSGVAPL